MSATKLAWVLAATIALAGCGSDSDEASKTVSEPPQAPVIEPSQEPDKAAVKVLAVAPEQIEEKTVAKANPAALFCEEQGEYDLATGDCILRDETRVNAWEYFRSQSADNEQLGMANPAAVFCEEQGTYDSVLENCTLEDGTQVDAWEFYRSQKASMTKPVGKPNPAAEFCNEHGEYNIGTSECTLTDGTVVDAWEYFRSQQ